MLVEIGFERRRQGSEGCAMRLQASVIFRLEREPPSQPQGAFGARGMIREQEQR